MAKMGRPRKDQGEAGTSQIRINDDLAVMLSELLLVMPNKTTAQIVDPFLRPELTLLHERHKAQIEKVKAAIEAAEQARLKAIQESEELERQGPGKKPKPKPGS